ncbi:MAG: metal ABC transporter permease [Spirochaetes bacterium]|nr:metal ABC transporter permease [Spirochaetota bacterium]
MTDFLALVVNPDLPFLRYALLAGILASAAFGVVGSLVVVKRISYIAGAISHAALGGIGAALYLQYHFGWSFMTPITGALLSALLAGGIISFVNLRFKQREDTIIGIIWAVGMATGLLFLSRTPGYTDPMSYLFGNILIIGQNDLWMILILDVVVVAAAILFYNQFLAVSFDENFARVRGMRTGFYQGLLIIMTALTVVLMTTLVGIVMVIALLTIPAAVAGLLTRRLKFMMLAAALACLLFTTTGLAVSYIWDAPSGAVIILVASAGYLLVLAFSQTQKLLRARRRSV